VVDCNTAKGVASQETALKRFLQDEPFSDILQKRKKGIFYRYF